MKFRSDIIKLSTEEFPDSKNLKNGSTCYNVDNGELYMFYKGIWHLQTFNESEE